VRPLEALIRARIRDEGPISLATFIEIALFHPEHGYYLAREPFGREGDFVTAPEISPLFGETIGLWLADLWRQMGAPDPIQLVELGPGRGTLLADSLRAIATAAPRLPPALRLHLVEVSPRLAGRQAEALARMAPAVSVRWHRALAEVPPGPLLLIANEFFDALPIRQYLRTSSGWRERRIGVDPATDTLAFVLVNADPPRLPPTLAEADEGAVVEVCPAAEAMAQTLATRIVDHRGAALILDFGPTRSGTGDSLQALRGHRFADPLVDPGTADLAHHVDFAALAAAAAEAGARPYGPIAQGLWLGRMGIAERAEAQASAAPERTNQITGAVRRLMHPGRMGVLFKALAITDPGMPPPTGFTPSGG
jgi:NADH dehydrogenase [ubiquinone] 1 alpha subcomplex assembly factor 7